MGNKKVRWLQLRHNGRVSVDTGSLNPITFLALDENEIDRPHIVSLSAHQAEYLARELRAAAAECDRWAKSHHKIGE